MEQRLQQQGMPAQGNMPAATFNPEAQRRVKLLNFKHHIFTCQLRCVVFLWES
jgi:hypothetical protein